MLVIVTLLLGWNSEATVVINVQKVALKFFKCREGFVVQFGTANVGVKTLVRSCVEMMGTSTANGAFEQVRIRVWDASMIAITG